jgi:hypothetical protein
MATASKMDPVIEAYKRDVDRTLLIENLRLTVQQRFDKFEGFMESVMALRESGARHREQQKNWTDQANQTSAGSP